MIIRKRKLGQVKPSEITPREKFFNRRELMVAAAAAGVLGLPAQAALPGHKKWPQSLDEEEVTPLKKASTYNNFYELNPSKGGPSSNRDFYQPKPWKVMVDGEVANPGEFDVEDLLGWAGLEERIYRMRCVERWSMIIPWVGYPFKRLMDKVEPTSNAKYVAFQTFNPDELFPDEANSSLDWPYVEGLRMDEAAHDLALLTFGAYGDELLTQNGAPVRMVVPWKYGYKSIKALVRISFTAERPPTSWNKSQPSEYGFFSNVNPDVPHPRWSQYKERFIGPGFFPVERRTEIFNGYADEVASIYAGMDLVVNR